MSALLMLVSGSGLLAAALKSAAIVLLAAGVAALLGRSSAAWRHLVWRLSVAGLLLLPLLSAGTARTGEWLGCRRGPPNHRSSPQPRQIAPRARGTNPVARRRGDRLAVRRCSCFGSRTAKCAAQPAVRRYENNQLFALCDVVGKCPVGRGRITVARSVGHRVVATGRPAPPLASRRRSSLADAAGRVAPATGLAPQGATAPIRIGAGAVDLGRSAARGAGALRGRGLARQAATVGAAA